MVEDKSISKEREGEGKELSRAWKNSSLLSSKILREVLEIANQTFRLIVSAFIIKIKL